MKGTSKGVPYFVISVLEIIIKKVLGKGKNPPIQKKGGYNYWYYSNF